jgi:hypothetical protein
VTFSFAMIKMEEASAMQNKEEECYEQKYDLDEESKIQLLKQHKLVEQQERDLLVICSSVKISGCKSVNLHAISDFSVYIL